MTFEYGNKLRPQEPLCLGGRNQHEEKVATALYVKAMGENPDPLAGDFLNNRRLKKLWKRLERQGAMFDTRCAHGRAERRQIRRWSHREMFYQDRLLLSYAK